MKTIKTILLIFTLSFLFTFQVNAKNSELTIKTNQKSIETTDTLLITVKSDFETKRPIFIYLIDKELNHQKRIGVIRLKNKMGKLQWKVSEKILGNLKKNERSTYQIRTSVRHQRNWIRNFSSNFEIRLNGTEASELFSDDAPETLKEKKTPEPETENKPNLNSLNKQLVNEYIFSGQFEPWKIQRLTLVNDSENDGYEIDINESNSNIHSVSIEYLNEDNILKEKTVPFINNQAIFNGIDTFVPRNLSTNVKFYAYFSTEQSTNLSTQNKANLGLLNIGLSARYFEATGTISGLKDTKGNSLKIDPVNRNKTIVIQPTQPVFSANGNFQKTLIEGENTVFDFDVKSADNSLISLGRLVFNVSQSEIGSIDQVEIRRNGSRLKAGDDLQIGDVYLVWDSGNQSCFAHTQQVGINTGMNCTGGTQGTSKLIITFTNSEIISSETNYRISLVAKQTNKNSTMEVSLSSQDDNQIINFPGSDSVNGSIYNGSGLDELFQNDQDFIYEASQIKDRNIIWSDYSTLGKHEHPKFIPGKPVKIEPNSSKDFTNGFGLNIDSIPRFYLSK